MIHLFGFSDQIVADSVNVLVSLPPAGLVQQTAKAEMHVVVVVAKRPKQPRSAPDQPVPRNVGRQRAAPDPSCLDHHCAERWPSPRLERSESPCVFF